MAVQVIVLNGGSSSGKTTIAAAVQTVLPNPWLVLGADTFVDALPASMEGSDAGIEITPNGEVPVGPEFRALEAAWMEGVAAMIHAGAPVIIDEIFLGGEESQQRWQRVLAGLDVFWVAVRCDGAVATAREAARGDRVTGMAESQAELVHQGVTYDLVVDTTDTEPTECARTITAMAGLAP